MNEIEKLALDIARCSELAAAYGDKSHPCNEIVSGHPVQVGGFRQVPEAWAGNLAEARILFMSSNPSISQPEVEGTGEDYPLGGYHDVRTAHAEWDDARVVDFQTRRFDQARERPFVNGKAQFLCADNLYRGSDKVSSVNSSQNYWKAAFLQARRLIGDEFDLGRDICLSEFVHCKSTGEDGVRGAIQTCPDRYLHRIVELSNARLMLLGGSRVRDRLHENIKSWNDSHSQTWEISENFGHLKTSQHDAADHVGLLQIGGRQMVLIATQQLSWATNKYRFVENVIGEHSVGRLREYLLAEGPLRFKDRNDLLDYLGLA